MLELIIKNKPMFEQKENCLLVVVLDCSLCGIKIGGEDGERAPVQGGPVVPYILLSCLEQCAGH